MISFLSYGKSAFIPVMLSRVHGLSLTEIGTLLALSGIVAGVLGTMIGGFIADRAAKTDVRAYMTIPMVAFILSVPFFLFGMFADNAWPVIDMTRRSIEEAAAAIINLCNERRDAAT
jgi:predicted MFS family arabinose efflux permease